MAIGDLVYITIISSLDYSNGFLTTSFALSFIYKIILLKDKSGYATLCLKTYRVLQTFYGISLCSLVSHKIPIRYVA